MHEVPHVGISVQSVIAARTRPFIDRTLCLQLREPEVLCCDYGFVTRTRDSIQSRD